MKCKYSALILPNIDTLKQLLSPLVNVYQCLSMFIFARVAPTFENKVHDVHVSIFCCGVNRFQPIFVFSRDVCALRKQQTNNSCKIIFIVYIIYSIYCHLLQSVYVYHKVSTSNKLRQVTNDNFLKHEF